MEDYLNQHKVGASFNEHGSSRINDLPKGLEHKIDFTLFKPEAVYHFAMSTYRAFDIENPTFYTALKNFFVEAYTPPPHSRAQFSSFTIEPSFCNMLTLEQMDKVKAFMPEKIGEDLTFIGAYFQKVFHEELSSEYQDTLNSEQKYANLETLLRYAKTNKMPNSLISSLVHELLNLGIELRRYSQEYFNLYLELPQFTNKTIKRKGIKQNYDSRWNTHLHNVQCQASRSNDNSNVQNNIIKKYLEHFCESKGNLQDFVKDFSTDYLKQIEDEVKIYKSGSAGVQNLEGINMQKYNKVADEVILRFLEGNTEFFTVEEEVKLKVELKNINTLYVKLFEFNTETYYKKTLQPFNTSINLDGLVAKEEQKHEYVVTEFPPT